MAFHHNHLSQDLSFNHFTDQHQPPPPQPPPPPPQQQQHFQEAPPPNWLNTALLRSSDNNNNFLNLHTATANTTTASSSDSPSSAAAAAAANQWLSRSSSFLQRNNNNNASIVGDGIDDVTGGADTMIQGEMKTGGGENKNDGGGATAADGVVSWQNARHKAEILSHPLYEQLLSAHVACLRIATPVDQLPRIDAQLAQSQHVVAKYSALGAAAQGLVGDDKELDQFMTHYVLLLCSFKEQLQQHVRVHAMEAVMACWEIEQSLQSLTGVSPGEGMGATMSDDEDEQVESDANMFDGGLDVLGFGPLIPTESERSLMERVRQELKHELKQGYKEKIVDIREEILRKRRAGKLPGDTTSVLKAWWQSHSKWPYPTEEDKARLVQETGLQLKQINNWFINQRKRNWHSNPSSSTVLKNKRKR
ncbi:homeobox protein knotted-1-like 3 [Arabidopsis thaliana]|uniref:Homeobox protein knotted-1-like 3 n=1 Tax=Arabidopsis thaliana TaxID=3702 RepID=F4JWP8_ARATH|nr:homeobox protein knotted-1-like 3 [Arabidopsis thaliana]AED93414.1 homeobox protein knotted-1-like 3 [Arabidopsis thaliana]|eukprot:NP_001031938.1 homeobox protein knotted-1-like 3 [Arabidopsis thaliana]